MATRMSKQRWILCKMSLIRRTYEARPTRLEGIGTFQG